MVPSASFLCGGSLALHLLLARSSTPSRRSSSRSTLLACLPFCSASSRDPLWSATGCAQAMLRRTAPTSARSGEGELHHRRKPSRVRAAVLRTQPRRTPTRASFAAGAGRRPEDPALLRRSRHPSPRRRLRARRPRLPGRIWPPATRSGRGHPAAAPTWPDLAARRRIVVASILRSVRSPASKADKNKNCFV